MVNIAVVGCGNWGKNYVRNFSEIQGCNLSICCDLSNERLDKIKQRYSNVRTTNSFQDIIGDPEIDAVVIATPASTHFTLAKAALLKGKHVLVEKPFTISSSEGNVLVNLSRRLKKVVMVGHILDYHPALERLKEYIKSGELGKIYYLYANRTNLGVVRTDVSVMWDLAPHDVGTLLYLLDQKPIAVAMKGQAFINKGIEDVAFLTLKFPDGIIANIHVSWLDPCKVRKTTIIGEKKMIVFDDSETSEKIKIYNKGVNKREDATASGDHRFFNGNGTNGTNGSLESFAEFQYTFSYGDVYIPQIKMTEPLRNECREFIRCIETGEKPRTDAENGRDVVRILEAAELSKRENGRYVSLGENGFFEIDGENNFIVRARSLWRELRLVKG